MWVWWTACLILGVPAVLLILLNWVGSVAALRAGRGYSVPLPGAFGVAGAVACRMCPAETVRSLWRLPLVLDLGCLVLVFTLLAVLRHAVARLTGRRSPFDPPAGPGG